MCPDPADDCCARRETSGSRTRWWHGGGIAGDALRGKAAARWRSPCRAIEPSGSRSGSTILDVSREAGTLPEDLFVLPEWRGHGIGRRLLSHLARLAVRAAAAAWSGRARLERIGGRLLPQAWRDCMEDWRICRLTGDTLAALGGGDDADATGSGGDEKRPAIGFESRPGNEYDEPWMKTCSAFPCA